MEITEQAVLVIQQEAWELRQNNFPACIQFDYPAATQVISLTGTDCALDCAHCGGRYLKKMTPVNSFGWQGEIEKGAYTSCLVSGGCDQAGRIPLAGSWPLLTKLKKVRKINLHVGLVTAAEAARLPEICDVVSFDFVGDNETIKEVYGLDKKVTDYLDSYRILRKFVQVLPHICIGLRGGKISGEYLALELLKKEDLDGLVFIVFSPTKNTRYAGKKPPPLSEVVKIMATARILFPHKPIYLGCMRPRGQYRAALDMWAVRCGLNKLVVPTGAAVKVAQELGLTILTGQECCVL